MFELYHSFCTGSLLLRILVMFFGLICLRRHLNSWDNLANKASPNLKRVNPHALAKILTRIVCDLSDNYSYLRLVKL